MKIGLYVTARMGSKRLKNKHFKKINSKYAVDVLIERLIEEFKQEIEVGLIDLIICSGQKRTNFTFNKLSNRYMMPLKIYYGDENNIPLRHFQAAKTFNLDAIISIDGDDILVSTAAARKVFHSLSGGSSQVKTIGLPLGMNVMGYSKDCLSKALENSGKLVSETGWTNVFESNNWQEISFHLNDDRIRMTLDYDADLEFFCALASQIYDYNKLNDADLIKAIIERNLYEINSKVSAEYWRNFNFEQNSQL